MTVDKAAALARVAKLVPSLGRDSENEILSTVRLIGRALKSGGLDFHDLARLLETAPGQRPAPAPPWQTKPAPPTPPPPPPSSQWVPLNLSKILAEEIAPRIDDLDQHSRKSFMRIYRELLSGRMVSRVEHDLLLGIVTNLRRTP